MTPEMMFGLPPTPEQRLALAQQQRQAEEFQRLAAASEVAGRERVLHWAALLCSCRRWYRPQSDPPQAFCAVHGQQLVTPDGRVL